MRALVFGSTGQVARELRRSAGDLGIDATFLDRAAADLADPEICAAAVRSASADVVVNAAAYTQVDKAESDVATAEAVNGTAAGRLGVRGADKPGRQRLAGRRRDRVPRCGHRGQHRGRRGRRRDQGPAGECGRGRQSGAGVARALSRNRTRMLVRTCGG